MNNFQKRFNKLKLNITEKEVIDLLSFKHIVKGEYDICTLLYLVTPDLEIQEFHEIRGAYIGSMILREELGFNKGEKPGDFDIIVIPYTDHKIHFERTGVFEVKIVRPAVINPSRSPNSTGVTQTKGLIKDGFPFVGLMHVSVTEPLPDHLKSNIKFCTLPVGNNTKFEAGKTFDDYLVDIKADHFSWVSTDKQLKRLLSTELPKYVCLNCFGVDKMEDGRFRFIQVSEHLRRFTGGYFNPRLKQETINRVRQHFHNNIEKYLKRPVKRI